MKLFGWSASLVVVLCFGAAMAAPGTRIKRQEAEISAEVVNPVGSEDASLSNDLDRDKRKIPSDPKFEAKNAILGFVFGASKQSSQALKDAINPTRPPPKAPTDDAVEFNRQKVSLQVPDAVFGSSFSLVTNISTQFGNLIMNSARRAGEFLWILQPLIGKNLTIEVPTTTTTTQRTTTSRGTTASSSNAAMTTTTASASTSSETNEIK